MRTISIVNQEPYSGKTTTAMNLGAALVEEGHEVLLIDADPRGVLTEVLGVEAPRKSVGLYDVITGDAEMGEAVKETGIEQLSVVDADIRLAAAEYDLAGVLGREFVLGEELNPVEGKYDICLIDCAPFLGLVTLNAMVASEDVIVPIHVGEHSEAALEQLMNMVEHVKERFAPCAVKVRGLLQTIVDKRRKAVQQSQRKLKRNYKKVLFKTEISKSPAVADAMEAGEPVLSYSPKSKGATQYRALAEEISNG